MFEHHTEPLLPKHHFRRRVSRYAFFSMEILFACLLLGMVGFHFFADEAWIDALLNSAMLLGGMGLVGEIQSTGGKLFASVFALFAGIVFLASVTILFAPIVHRVMHRFHLKDK